MQRRPFIAAILAILAAPFRRLIAGDGRLHSFTPPAISAPPRPTPPVTVALPLTSSAPPRYLISSELTAPPAPPAHEMAYNINGDWHPSTAKIANHLLWSHQINPAGMTRPQMLATHDYAHDRRRAIRAIGNCPGGICPPRRFP